MDQKEKTQVVQDETTIYEIDLECIRRDGKRKRQTPSSEKKE